MSELVRLSFSLEQSLLTHLEEMRQARGYANRSEFLRDMMRDHLVAHEGDDAHEALGTITLVYNHHSRQLNEKLIDLQHHHYDAILAATHVHLNADLCAEMILVKAPAQQLRKLADRLRQQKGILHATLSISSTGEHLV